MKHYINNWFFFFQAEDGIRDVAVTGVQTCALPIYREASTVCTRWFATVTSIAATPVMSMTTTFARLVRIPRSSCSVNCRARCGSITPMIGRINRRSEEHTSELQSRLHLVCRLLLEKKKPPRT